MKTIVGMVAAAAGLALAGCAGTNGNGSSGLAQASTAGAGMSYCQRDKLVEADGKLTCNWARSTKEACEGSALTSIAKGTVASGPDKSTMCANGTPLVRVATK